MYVIAHKIYNKYQIAGYKTLQVGAFKGHTCGDVFDDIGDNISKKNSQYCELTGLYWLWKNCNDDYIGVCHYRRYFSTDLMGKNPVSERTILNKLARRKMIVPFHNSLNISVEEQYCRNSGFKKDLMVIRDIIMEKCPDYVIAYDSILNGKKIYFFNMMIAQKKVFDEYCKWLFEILFEAERRIDVSDYNDYQKRIFGFLSERLLTVWICKNHIKPFEMGVINTEERWPILKRIATGLKRSVLSLKR